MAPNGAKYKYIKPLQSKISTITGLLELYKTSYEKLEENYKEIMHVGNMFVALLT